MNWKFKGKEQVESQLVNICFPWFNVSLETYFANITIIMIIPQYCHWKGLPILFLKKFPFIFQSWLLVGSQLTARGLLVFVCVCVCVCFHLKWLSHYLKFVIIFECTNWLAIYNTITVQHCNLRKKTS